MMSILLVEDDEGDAFMLKEVIKSIGFESELYHARDGDEALSYLQSDQCPRPSMIFLDLNMPGMGGHEVLQWVKANDDLKDIPVGVLTTSSDEGDIRKAYQNHANFYLVKPDRDEDLQSLVKMIEDFWMKTVRLPTKDKG